MKLGVRVALSVALCVAAYLALWLLEPAASLASNAVTVAQMQNSDTASLAVQYVGNGREWVRGIVGLVLIVALGIVWLWKSKNNKDQ
ncbi:MAG: hypothetical protein JO142_03310 [Burkholderiales bacterium]|nr:hypothetical protein [Burkholderiales bacterium]